ncbi:IS4 family transposase [bacterium]|nr:IS4 family transposase [bacterium]
MDILSRVAESMQTILTIVADKIAVKTGFIKRLRKLTGSIFLQTLVFGWLSNPDATLDELAQTAATLGLSITPQALDKRFTPQASDCLKQVLESTVETLITVDSQTIPIMQRFNGVYIQDSSTITLPDELSAIWAGCGGSSPQNTSSSVKIQVRWDLKNGTMIGPYLQQGRQHDQNSCFTEMSLPQRALRLAVSRRRALLFADLGYFSLDDFAQLNSDSVYWLTRVKSVCVVYDPKDNKFDLVEFLKTQSGDIIDQQIRLGAKKKVKCRLCAVRVADDVAIKRRRKIREYASNKGRTPSKRQLVLADWTVLATNVEADKMS